MSPVGALSDAAATLAIALGAALIVWNDEIARAITDRLGWFGLAARRAARASCLVAGVMIAALGAVCAVASAQSLGDIPQCALACFAAAVPASGCSLTDQKCQCTTGKSKIEDSITQCVPGKCSAEEIASMSLLPFEPLYQKMSANVR